LEVCNDNGGDGCCNTCELPVEVIGAPPCDIEGPIAICEDGEPQVYCVPAGYDTLDWDIAGDGEIIDAEDNCVLVNPTGPGEFTLYAVVCYSDPLCCAGCELTVDVVPTPDCTINSGPTTVCEDTAGIEYCAPAGADSYSWSIEGNGVIVGPTDGQCVIVDAGAEGSFLLTVEVCNELDVIAPAVEIALGCCASCELEVTVEACGGGYCTFTQGFYGNDGGIGCDGLTTTEIINAVILPDNPVIVGALALDPEDTEGPSIIFDSAACIIERLPAGGKPRPLPSDLGNANCDDELSPPLVKGKKPEIANTLVGQTVALTLNLRLHTIPCMDEEGFELGLGDYVFPAPADPEDPEAVVYICVQKGEEGCIERYMVPEVLWGMPVSVVLEMANEALAGDEELVNGAYAGASFVNELFDECLTIVSCPVDPVEDCGNGCDDDFDGLTDLDDPDCLI
jgi:hypothetical protein